MLNHMVEQHAHLDAVFHALADPTRRAMLGQLAERELTIGELATPFSMSFAGASKHVRVLEHAGLVTRTIRGRTHLCRLEAARLAEANAWLRRYQRFWTAKLDTLEALLLAEDEHLAFEQRRTERGHGICAEGLVQIEPADLAAECRFEALDGEAVCVRAGFGPGSDRGAGVWSEDGHASTVADEKLSCPFKD